MIDTAADCFALMLEAGSQADCTCCAISLEEAVTLPSRWRHRRGVWRSLAVEKLSQIELRTEAWYIKPRFKRQTCKGENRFGCRRSAWRRSAKRAMRQLPQQPARQNDANGCDRVWIMTPGAYAATRVAGSSAAARRPRIQADQLGQRGKNGSARPPGTHKLQYIAWRGGETRASCGLPSGPAPTLVSAPRNPVR